MKNKKAQSWGMDLMIGVSIFTLGLVAFYIYSLNSPGEAKENLETLSYEGKILANTILSEGSPTGWNKTSVVKIGILSDDKINETKLQYFYELTEEDYNKTRSKFDTTYDYYFYLNENMIIDEEPVAGIGKPDFANAKNLVKITRYTIYRNKPTTAYVYIWEER
jgi:hypothetical protein